MNKKDLFNRMLEGSIAFMSQHEDHLHCFIKRVRDYGLMNITR